MISIRPTKTRGKDTPIMQCKTIPAIWLQKKPRKTQVTWERQLSQQYQNLAEASHASVCSPAWQCSGQFRLVLPTSVLKSVSVESQVSKRENETLAFMKFANKKIITLKELTWERKSFQRCGSPHTEHLVLAWVPAFLYCAVCQAGWWPSALR